MILCVPLVPLYAVSTYALIPTKHTETTLLLVPREKEINQMGWQALSIKVIGYNLCQCIHMILNQWTDTIRSQPSSSLSNTCTHTHTHSGDTHTHTITIIIIIDVALAMTWHDMKEVPVVQWNRRQLDLDQFHSFHTQSSSVIIPSFNQALFRCSSQFMIIGGSVQYFLYWYLSHTEL